METSIEVGECDICGVEWRSVELHPDGSMRCWACASEYEAEEEQ